jgi:general secretion pathway protein A
MYTEFSGLREKPFSLSPDPRFLFLSASHREALAHLLYGIEQGEGFIAITGEVGTGKTTLCRTLLQRLEPGSEIAFLFNTQLSGLELLQAITAEFGLPVEGQSRRELMAQLNDFLLTKKQEGRRVLLLIDEAQNLDSEALEQVRLLSNLETDTQKLIQIVLIGQPELDAMLESPHLRQLRQRISVRWRLNSLSASETREYIRHRLRVAAGKPLEVFTEMALREVHRRSTGIPRIVNRLCDRALLAGYSDGSREIGLGAVAQAQRELEGGGDEPRAALAERWRFPLGVAAGALVVALAAAAGLWWQQKYGASFRSQTGGAGRTS